ncbi:MAG: hypothetical protein HC800_06595 [Phormidesmis sp. RL_2_1]|nr:hypothetical protein [Phormidesmis sp. RL_2_1]
MPGARSIQQRYNAGSCRLDVTLQLSALSQWYPQPVAQELAFKLWLQVAIDDGASDSGSIDGSAIDNPINSTINDDEQSHESASMRLLAEGDRTTLQALATYFQQQSQANLFIASLNTSRAAASTARAATSTARAATSTAGKSPSVSSPQPISLPPNVHIEAQSLSYLQLCDLTSVLSQYEQATHTLPVALQPVSTSAAPPVSPPASSNIIPFPPSRHRFKLWASSAAAAVFAVGLTTTLWPEVSNQEVNDVTADSISRQTPTLKRDAVGNTADRIETAQSEEAQGEENEERVSPTEAITSQQAASPQAASQQAASQQAASPSPRARTQAESSSEPPVGAKPSSTENSSSDGPAAPTASRIATAGAERQALPSSADEHREAVNNADEHNADEHSVELLNEEGFSAAAAAVSSQEAAIIAEVQAYFQTRWPLDQPTAQDSLIYRLQLSESGEVIGFVAINEAAQAYRDRLLSSDEPPVFAGPGAVPTSPTPTSSRTRTGATALENSDEAGDTGLTLRLVLMSDGQVNVSKF